MGNSNGAIPSKETEIFVIEGILSYANCAVRGRNFTVLQNSINSPVTSGIPGWASHCKLLSAGAVTWFHRKHS